MAQLLQHGTMVTVSHVTQALSQSLSSLARQLNYIAAVLHYQLTTQCNVHLKLISSVVSSVSVL